MSNTRTDEELKNPDFNYYFAYSIDPSENNASKIETEILKEQNKFTEKTTSKNRRLLELKEETLDIMKNDAKRKEELKKAKTFKLNDCREYVVSTLEARQSIPKTEITKIVNENKKWLSRSEIEEKIGDLFVNGAKLIDDEKGKAKFALYKKIKDDLFTLNEKDLYSWLSKFSEKPLSPNKSSDGEITNAIINANSKKYGNLKDITANDDLVMNTKEVLLKDEKSKKHYDSYIELLDVWFRFDLISKTTKTIESMEYESLFNKAMKNLSTLDTDYIEKLFYEGLYFYGISVLGRINKDGVKLEFEHCPYCRQAYFKEEKPRACPNCGKPLEISCWNCKTAYSMKNKTCSSCGAAKEQKSYFDAIVKNINVLLVQQDSLADIQAEFDKLINLLLDYKKNSGSELSKKVAEYQVKIKELEKIEKSEGEAYKKEYEKLLELINSKKFVSASIAVAILKNKYPKYSIIKTNELAGEINIVISQSKQHTEKVKTYISQNNEEAAVNEAAAALNLSADFIEAKQIVSVKFPPKVPESINAVVKENSVQITWGQNKPQKLATYSVIRKNGSRPTSVNDGEVIASDLSITSWQDKGLNPGVPCYYAVFSSRLGENSAIIAAETPVVIHFDVLNIRQEYALGKIVVKWEVPFNVREVEVIRKKGHIPPVSRTDGEKIKIINNEMFEDNDYDKNGNSYLIICVYKNEKGLTYSKGVTRLYKAFEEIKQLSNIKIKQNDITSFILSCDNVISGKRKVYYSTQEINCKFGTVIQLKDFKESYKSLSETNLNTTDETTAVFNLPTDNEYYVYPSIYNEQLIIVSKPVKVNTRVFTREKPNIRCHCRFEPVKLFSKSKMRTLTVIMNSKATGKMITKKPELILCAFEKSSDRPCLHNPEDEPNVKFDSGTIKELKEIQFKESEFTFTHTFKVPVNPNHPKLVGIPFEKWNFAIFYTDEEYKDCVIYDNPIKT